MEAFIIYIVKSGICIGIFLTIYVLFMRRTTFFRFNRFFLLTGFIASLVIPAIDITYDVIISMPVVSAIDDYTNVASSAATYSAINIWSIIFTVYCFGTGILILRNILSYRKLSAFVSSGKKIEHGNYNLIENDTVKSPFTVLNYILINTEKLGQTEKDLILKHEKTHIDQKHWVDLICSECMLLLQWFNPLVWVYIRLLKENHEYLADQAVINSGISPVLYQAVLINQEFQGPVFSFSNSFNYSKPLNRLSMIKKTKSASWKRLAALIIVPAFGLFFWASAEPRYIIEQADNIPELLLDKDFSNDTINLRLDIRSNDNDSIEKKRIIIIGNKDSINNKNKSFKARVLSTNKDKEPLIIVNGKEISDIESIDPDNIDNVSIIKNVNSELITIYGEKARNGVVTVTTKSKNGTPVTLTTKMIRMNKDSSKVKTYHLDFNIDDSIKVVPTYKLAVVNSPVKAAIVSLLDDSKDKPILIIDGEEMPFEEIRNIKTKNIESVSVLKDKSATKIYGDKGKNGVIVIKTKDKG